ncbi:hypothetical protein JZ751_013367 [Albula glossodonta]|uniref:TACI cysteine-rich domain-containing protein n=1 Tax=Albula glossodonta TaxID=121402 RepID=A0A8T2MZ68_9TELE|nr:hypothetical protein JZ751_013367 [Albula glossodonta]
MLGAVSPRGALVGGPGGDLWLCWTMARGCTDSQYWDRLLRQCMSCRTTCERQSQERCTEFCVSQRCRDKPGHFYDSLLKRCLLCTSLCGSHPAECAYACQTQPTTLRLMTSPLGDRTALQSSTTRGSSLHRGEHHTIIIYSLLGLCLAALVCTLSVAVLVLLCKARGCGGQAGAPGGHKTPDTIEEEEGSEVSTHRPSSQDRLMEVMAGGQGQAPMAEKESLPTETCMHCFPEIRVPCRGEDKLQLYQQTAVTVPPAGPSRHCRDSHTSLIKDNALRIICSPTQTTCISTGIGTATAAASLICIFKAARGETQRPCSRDAERTAHAGQ